jgi:hypothetical protein
MKRRAIIITIGVVGILIFGVIIGFGISKVTSGENKKDFRELTIVSDKEIIHRNEMFNLTVENVPDDANITWFLDDGNITFGKVCCYKYLYSDMYNISAQAIWDGGSGNGTIEIYACNLDVHFEDHGDNLFSIRPRSNNYEFCGRMFFYSCNLEDPVVSIDLQINDVVGLIHIEVIFWRHEQNGASGHSVVYENQFGTNSVITIQETFTDLEIEPSEYPYSLEVGIAVLEGRIGSYDLTMAAIYPQPT